MAETIDIGLHARGSIGVRGKVAEGALSLAERNRDVDAEGLIHTQINCFTEMISADASQPDSWFDRNRIPGRP